MSIPSDISVNLHTKKFDRRFLSNFNVIYIYIARLIFFVLGLVPISMVVHLEGLTTKRLCFNHLYCGKWGNIVIL